MPNDPQDTPKTALDADGTRHVYRLVSSRLESRANWSSVWSEVTGGEMLRMTPEQLRCVADVLERGR